eukprot:8101101-Alexandrium_andersonii.AAC.1
MSLTRCPGSLRQRGQGISHGARISAENSRACARREVLPPSAAAHCRSPLTPVRQQHAPALRCPVDR